MRSRGRRSEGVEGDHTGPIGYAGWRVRGLVAMLALALPVLVGAQTPPLRVVAVGSVPFLTDTGSGEPSGLSVDVWTAVASELGVESQYVVVDTVQTALDRVESGEADVAIGPISITADRAQQVRFIQPYLHASLAIAAPPTRSLLDRFAPFLSRTFAIGAAGLVGSLALVGTLFWLAERKANPSQFPENSVSGIGNGLWMALVTMTTVGYGDRVPMSTLGRVLAGGWMLLSMVMASSLTAFLATALTLSQIEAGAIEHAEELVGRRVGVVRGTTSEPFVDRYGGRAVPAADIDAAIAALVAGETEAVVFDRPVLRYVIDQDPQLGLQLSDGSYQPQNYGFAVRMGSDLASALDQAVLRLQESETLLAIEEEWLGAA